MAPSCLVTAEERVSGARFARCPDSSVLLAGVAGAVMHSWLSVCDLSGVLATTRHRLILHFDRLRRSLETLDQRLRDAVARAVAQAVEGGWVHVCG